MGHEGFGGSDTLIGGTNAINTLVGDAEHFVGPATGGDDTLIGGAGGTNYLIGDGIDTSGPAIGGNDRLVSAPNTTDSMWGDFQSGLSGFNLTGGADTFAFGRNNGNDFINDFQKGVDTIEIDSSPIKPLVAGHIPPQALDHLPPQAGGQFPATFADLNIQEVGGNSVIHFDANDSVTVVGVTGLTADDFHFVA
jgi:hypothetical protein